MKKAWPLVFYIGLILFWQALVMVKQIPDYFIPSPSRIIQQLRDDYPFLLNALVITLQTTLIALSIAWFISFICGIALYFSNPLRLIVMPLVTVIQTMPIIALAPLLLIYFESAKATLIIAVIIAFFPLLSGLLTGLMRSNAAMDDLFTLYKARPFQRLFFLRLPLALPFWMNGLKISTNLALVGAIVGEFSAGTGGGLATRLIESQYRLNTPRLFAALVLILLSGLVLSACISFVEKQLRQIYG